MSQCQLETGTLLKARRGGALGVSLLFACPFRANDGCGCLRRPARESSVLKVGSNVGLFGVCIFVLGIGVLPELVGSPD